MSRLNEIKKIRYKLDNANSLPKTGTVKPTTLADKVKAMAHCAIDAGIVDAVDWSAEIIRRLEDLPCEQ